MGMTRFIILSLLWLSLVFTANKNSDSGDEYQDPMHEFEDPVNCEYELSPETKFISVNGVNSTSQISLEEIKVLRELDEEFTGQKDEKSKELIKGINSEINKLCDEYKNRVFLNILGQFGLHPEKDQTLSEFYKKYKQIMAEKDSDSMIKDTQKEVKEIARLSIENYSKGVKELEGFDKKSQKELLSSIEQALNEFNEHYNSDKKDFTFAEVKEQLLKIYSEAASFPNNPQILASSYDQNSEIIEELKPYLNEYNKFTKAIWCMIRQVDNNKCSNNLKSKIASFEQVYQKKLEELEKINNNTKILTVALNKRKEIWLCQLKDFFSCLNQFSENPQQTSSLKEKLKQLARTLYINQNQFCSVGFKFIPTFKFENDKLTFDSQNEQGLVQNPTRSQESSSGARVNQRKENSVFSFFFAPNENQSRSGSSGIPSSNEKKPVQKEKRKFDTGRRKGNSLKD